MYAFECLSKCSFVQMPNQAIYITEPRVMNRLEMAIMMTVHVIARFPFSNTEYRINRLIPYSLVNPLFR